MNQIAVAGNLHYMRQLAHIWVWCLGFATLAAATPALADKKVYPADGVTRIVFSTPGELVVRPGTEERLVVEAEAKVLAQLDISAKGGILSLRSKGSFKTDKGLKYTLTIKAFRGLKTTASGNSLIEGFSGAEMEIDAGGSGNIDLKNMSASRLALSISDSGNIVAAGSGKSLVARIDGAGTIEAASFPAKSVDARLEGSGSIRVHAVETLKAVINGSGDIEYKGNAKVSKTINGAGSIDRM